MDRHLRFARKESEHSRKIPFVTSDVPRWIVPKTIAAALSIYLLLVLFLGV